MAGILDAFRLDGKIAVVTGSERGLGRGMAVALAQAGADVLGVTYAAAAPETAAAIAAAGRRYVHVQADLSSLEPIQGVIDAALAAYGRIDILVNNAGIITRNDSVDFTEKEWDDVMNINVKAVFFMCQAVARQFIKQGTGGKIVNIASMLSFQGGIRVPSYTASKSGVKGITMLMANEWAKHGITVITPELGEKFDPNFHQAISMVDSEQEANTVVTVLQKGYLIAERVLRPALVMVAKPKA